MEEIDNAFREASMGMPATRPVLEMTIPTSVDTTIAPPGKHVVQLFVQFAPYDVNPKIGEFFFSSMVRCRKRCSTCNSPQNLKLHDRLVQVTGQIRPSRMRLLTAASRSWMSSRLASHRR